MSYKILMGFFAALSFVFLAADSPPVIELKPGLNEVTLKVLNNCNSDVEAIQVVIKEENLPEGLIISSDPQQLNVSAKSQSKDGLQLVIKVTEDARHGSYEIPLIFKDKANHSWKYTITAELKLNKPDKYDLSQNYPNPFNTNTQIKYALANDQEQQTKLIIFDLLGKQTKTLVNKKQPAGFYQINWNGKDDSGALVASGVYFFKLSSGSFVSIRKLTVLKYRRMIMWLRSNNYWLTASIMIVVFMGLCGTRLIAQQHQELVVTIEPLSSSDKLIHFAKVEDFRIQMKFREAIAEYQQVILPGDPCDKEAEAHYDIGLCYLWLVKLDTAETVFHEMMKTYSDSNEVIAFSRYGLSWIDVQRGKFQDAIDRLQLTLDENVYADKEFCAKAQFEIGRIYLVFLHNNEKAAQSFRKVLAAYPDAEITNHPFMEKVKGN